MADIPFRQKVLFRSFIDHACNLALSALYPFLPASHAALRQVNGSKPVCVEAELNYPCIQIYSTTNIIPSLGHMRGQISIRKLLLDIIIAFDKSGYFTAFEGIRFEYYDRQPDFCRYLYSGELNPDLAKFISNHATEEREHRNVLAMYKSAMTRYNTLLGQMEVDGVDCTDRRKEITEKQQAFEEVSQVASLLSTEIREFNVWRMGQQKPVKLQQKNTRRNSVSDLMLPAMDDISSITHRGRSFSESGLQAHVNARSYVEDDSHTDDAAHSTFLRDLQTSRIAVNQQAAKSPLKAHALKPLSLTDAYVAKRFQQLTTPLEARFSAPIGPNSYAFVPNQPWHSMVILLQHPEVMKYGMYLFRFGRARGINQVSSAVGRSDFHFQRVYIDSLDHGPSFDLGLLIGQNLHQLGLSKPSESDSRCGLRPGMEEKLSFWFPDSCDTASQSLPLLDEHELEEELRSFAILEDVNEQVLVMAESKSRDMTSENGEPTDPDLNMDLDLPESLYFSLPV